MTYELLKAPDGATIDSQTGAIHWLSTNAGTYEFQLRVRDGRGGEALQEFTLTVKDNAPNVSPTIISTPTTQASIHQPYGYRLIATDENEDILFYDLVNAPFGMTINREQGNILWTPTTNQLGSHTVTVKVFDGRGGETLQTFTLDVLSQRTNQLPVITTNPSDDATVGQLYQYGVKATDVDGDSLSWSLLVHPDGMTLNPETGHLYWTPTSQQQGTYRVLMRVADGQGGVSVQDFLIRVNPLNTAPVITSTPITTVGANLPYSYQIQAQDDGQDPLSFTLDTAPQGMTVDKTTRRLIWQPTDTQMGTHTVTIRVTDGQGAFTTQNVTLNVVANRQNDAPIVKAIPEGEISLRRPYLSQINASDPNGDPLTYSLKTAPEGLKISSEGLLSWTPDQLGDYPVELLISDGLGGITDVNFTLAVVSQNQNQTPLINTTPNSLNATVGKTYRYNPTANDPDGHQLLWQLITSPRGMSIDRLTGTLRWTPTSDQLGNHEVELLVVDSQGAIRPQSFSLTVRGVNIAPTVSSNPLTTATIGQLYQYLVFAKDTEGQSLTYSLQNSPDGLRINQQTGLIQWTPQPNQQGNHTITVAITDELGATTQHRYTLEVQETLINQPPIITSTPIFGGTLGETYTYTVTAYDPDGDNVNSLNRNNINKVQENNVNRLEEDNTNQIQVNHVNRLEGDNTNEIQVDNVNSLDGNNTNQVQVNHINSLDGNNTNQIQVNNITFQLLKGPEGITIDSNTGKIEWKNPILSNHTIAVAAIDRFGAGAVQEWKLNIMANGAPIIKSTPVITAVVGQPYRYDLHGSDSNGDTLTYHLITAPDGMTVDNLGRIIWTPKTQNMGNNTVKIAVTDSRGATVTQSFNLTVTVDNIAPIIQVTPSIRPVNLGESVTLFVKATDNIGVKTINLTVNGQAVPLNSDGLYTFTPKEIGTIVAVATAIDTSGNNKSMTTTFEVLDFNDVDAPIINLPALANNTITSPIEIMGTVIDYDDNNHDTLQYYTLEVAKLGTNNFQEIFKGTKSVNNGVLGTFDPSLLENDAYTLRLKAVDGGGNTVFVDRTINIEGNLKLGNFQLSFTDLSIPVAGIPISVTRTYDTLTSQERDDFGYGWRLEFRDTNLRTSLGKDDYYETFDIIGKGFKEGDKVYLTLPGGQREAFTFKPKLDPLGAFLQSAAGGLGIEEDPGLYHPTFVSESDSNNVLTVKDVLIIRTGTGEFTGVAANLYNPIDSYFGGQYTLTTGEGIVYEIDAETGDLLTVTDTNNNRLTFSENGIISDTGVEVKFLRDAKGRIISLVDPMGNVIKYGYDSQGDLIKVIDREGNETKFDYDEKIEHYLEKIIDPLNREAVRTEYDENGRLKKVIDVKGEAVELVYDLNNSVQTVKDVFGNETIYVYDERGNILTEVDAVGKVIKRTYDEDNNLLTETIITDESGKEGYTTSYTYDDKGNQLTEMDAKGNKTYYTYGKFNRLLSETDGLGNTTTYDYGVRTGNLLSTKDAQGNLTKFSYDNRGNLINLTDAANNLTQFEYDLQGNVTRIIDANGHQTNYTYDSNGNQLTESKTVTTSQGIVNILTQNTYDKQGNLLSVKDAENNTTYYEYNTLNKQSAVIDGLGRRTQYLYDDKGQLVETIYPDSTPETLEDNPRTITVYDRGSRQKATIDQAGRVTYYNYDEIGRLVETIYPDAVDTLSQFVSFIDGSKTVTTIDWTEVIYPNSNPSYLNDNPRTKTEYYQNGQVKGNIDERGHNTEYIYDVNDQLIKIIYPELADNPGINFITTNTYDVVGRKIAETDGLGRTNNYVYDELGKLIKTQFADGTYLTSTYDKLGRRIATTDQEGKITNYEYDSLGRLTNVLQFVKQNSLNPTEIRTEYGYDELSRLIWVEDANNHKTTYEYDKVGRRTVAELPSLQRSITSYDAVGNIKTVKDFNQEIITYFYNEQNRLIKKQFSDHSSVDYTYTITGLRETVNDSRGITTYTYNERDKLIAQTDPSGVYLDNGNTLRYSYDLAGNRTSVTTPSGTVNYTYDEWNRLKTVVDADNNQTIYVYDGVSNLIKTTLPNGVVETRDYDNLNRLIEVENKLGNQVISGYEYTLDKVGNRLKVEENDGRVVKYNYDNLYRLIEEKITDSSDRVNDGRIISYTYDAVGNRLTKVDSVEGTITYVYNSNDWLLTETEDSGDVKEYEYDNNGNTIKVKQGSGETIYDWDYENRLVSVTLSDGTEINYEYDVNNIRKSQEVNGIRTDYLVDSNQSYAQVLEEYVNGELEVSYVYGLDLISQERGTEISIYLVDGLGSTRVLTDEKGLVINHYDYDAFGNLINSNSSVENNYLFAGEQFDENLEQYYLRQRYYNQEVGRFTRRDTYEGNIFEPITLNKYMYANANPVNFTDPTGLFTLTEVLSWTAVYSVLLSVGGSVNYIAYCSTQPTEEEKKHRNQAVSTTKFINYVKGKTLEALQVEAGVGTDQIGPFQVNFFLGPKENYRYVEDPSDLTRAIDMRHVLYFGIQGETIGWLNELQQKFRGFPSAFQLEDFRSNYFGTVFYKNYYSSDKKIEEVFTLFFADLAAGKIIYDNC